MSILSHTSLDEELPDNSSFVNAMQACGDNFADQNRVNLYRELLRTTLLVPASRVIADPETGTIEDAADVDFLVKRNPHTGDSMMLAFTDREAMTVYKTVGMPFVSIPATQLLEHLAGNLEVPLIVCAQESHLPVSLKEIRQLAAGTIPPPQLEGTPAPPRKLSNIEFCALDAPLPASTQKELEVALARRPDITTVHAFLVREPGQAPDFAVGVIFTTIPDEEVIRPVLDEIAGIIKPLTPFGMTLTVIPLTKEAGFACDITEMIPACYQRGGS